MAAAAALGEVVTAVQERMATEVQVRRRCSADTTQVVAGAKGRGGAKTRVWSRFDMRNGDSEREGNGNGCEYKLGKHSGSGQAGMPASGTAVPDACALICSLRLLSGPESKRGPPICRVHNLLPASSIDLAVACAFFARCHSLPSRVRILTRCHSAFPYSQFCSSAIFLANPVLHLHLDQ